jgi:hypothetical protein
VEINNVVATHEILQRAAFSSDPAELALLTERFTAPDCLKSTSGYMVCTELAGNAHTPAESLKKLAYTFSGNGPLSSDFICSALMQNPNFRAMRDSIPTLWREVRRLGAAYHIWLLGLERKVAGIEMDEDLKKIFKNALRNLSDGGEQRVEGKE